MPVPLMTWRASVLVSQTPSLAGYLAGLKTAVDAEVAAHPTAALWQVGHFNPSGGTLSLKNTPVGIAAGGSPARRLLLFGGSQPHGAAVDGAVSAGNALYCGVAPIGGVDVPPQGYTAGVPFTTGPWISGGTFIHPGGFGADVVQYYETYAGMVIAYRSTSMTNSHGNIATAFLGALAVTMDGEAARDMAAGSVGGWTVNQDSYANFSSEWMPTGDAANSAGYARASYHDPVNGITRMQRAYLTNGSNRSAYRGSNAERYFLPHVMRDVTNAYCRVQLRQIALGVRDTHDATISNVAGIQARKIGARSDVPEDGPWITNFRV